MSHPEWVSRNRTELVLLAKALIADEVGLIEGVRRINALRFEIDDPDNEIFLPIIGVESDTEDFPLGDSRKLYSEAYLAKMDSEIEPYLRDVRSGVLEACREIVKMYA